MTTPTRRPEEVFTVRLWFEESESGSQWRGYVMHVRSTERRYFANYGDLCEFLDRWHGSEP